MLGVLLLVASLVTALLGTLLPRFVSEVSVAEISNYCSDRFIHEPDLWRVQVRTIRGMLTLIQLTSGRGEEVAGAVRKAEYLFLGGLFSVGISLAILISTVTL